MKKSIVNRRLRAIKIMKTGPFNGPQSNGLQMPKKTLRMNGNHTGPVFAPTIL